MEYEWNYGDGHTENGSNLNIVTHNYSNVGSYDVTLTIILNDNSHWSCSYGITIMNPIRATITQNYTSGRSGITSFIFDGSQSVDVIPNSTLIYSWDLGDGTSATGAIIQGHIYQSEGSYRVTLTVSDSLGSGLSDAAQIVIYVGEDNTWIPLSGIYDCNTHLTTVFTGYIVSGTATISEGYTLTIDPGVIVKFMSNASINIDGTLIAQGTAASSIIFTSLKDDTAGGDTNQDGNTTPAAGDWGGINFGSTSSNDILDHVLVRYAINTVGITIVNPNQGSKGQTLNVTITGTSFIGATAVSFGDGIITNNFSVDGATQITANISIDAMTYLGARDVCIITPGGTGNLPNGFTVSQISKLCVSSYLSPVIAGVAVDFTVTAQDASGNTITNYVGTIHFTSSDPQAALPANYTFISGDNGTHTFNATLKTAGSQFITAIDVVTNTITGTQNSISVNPAFASQIRVETTTNGSGNIVSAQSVTVGSSITVYSVTRDQYGNFIANAVGTWSLANKTGTVADSDLVPAGDNKSAVFTGHSTGTTAIQILSTGLISTDSGLLTVLSTQVITPSNDATLSSLTISSGTLSPAFTSGTHDYTDNVADTVTSVTVTPTVAESHATVTVNGNAVTSSSASPSINLSAGSNIITIVVTAQDGSTRVIYTVTVIVTTTTTIHSGGASVVQSGAGVSTTISGSSAADGTNVTVASVDYGNNQPTGTGNVQLNGTEYYDVNVSSSTSLGAGAMARVSITSPSVTATSTMQYWYSGVWNTAGNISVNVGLISGDIPVAALGGTPVVIGTSSTGLPSTHVWHLDSTGHPVMEKTGTQSGSVDIAAGSSAIWLSDQAAAADVTFASGIWTIKLATTSDWSSTCSAQIGYFNTAGNGAFTAFNATAVSGTYSGGIITITITTGGDVSKNDYLALKIINGSGSSHSITTDGSSSLTAPSGSPNFPTPETPTVVLLGIGLVCLSGFLFVRRKKAIRGNIGQ
jgi:PKD repeat protein